MHVILFDFSISESTARTHARTLWNNYNEKNWVWPNEREREKMKKMDAENMKHTRKHMESKLPTHHSAVHFQFQNPIAAQTHIHLRAWAKKNDFSVSFHIR